MAIIRSKHLDKLSINNQHEYFTLRMPKGTFTMNKNLEELSAKDFIELAGNSIDEGRSHWEVHKEINRRIMELESLKTDMAMMKIVVEDLEALNEKLENRIEGWGL